MSHLTTRRHAGPPSLRECLDDYTGSPVRFRLPRQRDSSVVERLSDHPPPCRGSHPSLNARVTTSGKRGFESRRAERPLTSHPSLSAFPSPSPPRMPGRLQGIQRPPVRIRLRRNSPDSSAWQSTGMSSPTLSRNPAVPTNNRNQTLPRECRDDYRNHRQPVRFRPLPSGRVEQWWLGGCLPSPCRGSPQTISNPSLRMP